MNRKHLSLIFIIAIITAGVIFFAGDLIKKTSDEPLVLEEQNKANILESIDSNKENTLEPDKLPKPPALGRPLNVTTSISGLEKDEVLEQIKHFEASLINKPENLHEWIQLGNLRKIIGDYLGAIEYWKYASLLQPNYHVPFNNLGNLYQYYLNDALKAEEYFKKMIEVSPNNEDSYKNLFELYTLSYKEKENLAIAVLEEGIKTVTHNGNLKMMLENYKNEKGIQ